MCGILFCCCDVDEDAVAASPLRHRGPDSFGVHRIPASEEHDTPALTFCGCVLHQRGPEVVPQPLVSARGNVLLWNGEAYEGLPGVDCEDKSDTKLLLRAVEEALEEEEQTMAGADAAVSRVLEAVRGPFALVLYLPGLRRLFFARDLLGRRSLLAALDAAGRLRLSSVAPCGLAAADGVEEVPALGLFAADLSDIASSPPHFLLLPWDFRVGEAAAFGPLSGLPVTLDARRVLHSPLGAVLSPLPPVDEQSATAHCPGETPGAAASPSVAPPPLPALPASPEDLPLPLLATDEQRAAAQHLEDLLAAAVATRARLSSPRCLSCGSGSIPCAHAPLALLFSGGLDSAVLALLLHRCLPPAQRLDLLNVAFTDAAPDRRAAEATLAELRALAPSRPWALVRVDATAPELHALRAARIAGLLRPAGSVLDDALGCAVWFAARGWGAVGEGGEEYRCPARVLLLGMGADELMGGYSRHRGVFEVGGEAALESEMEKDLRRLHWRNLGRDDRAAADHGREPRMPFLDEAVVAFLAGLPARTRADLRLPRGRGDKILLRLVAWQLGLRRAATMPKRAMQFGSRIAKLEERKEKGDEVCARLTAAWAGTG